ncbi:putative Outer membrane protein [Helicobacter pylori 2018]|nr:putative Outer membrane protein [Helicobacter pylori 2018]
MSQEISKLPYNQVNTKDIITLPYDQNAPAAGQYNYQINPEQQSNLSQALAAMSNNPFKKVGMISSQNNNGALNGLGVQVGYKQFFGLSSTFNENRILITLNRTHLSQTPKAFRISA